MMRAARLALSLVLALTATAQATPAAADGVDVLVDSIFNHVTVRQDQPGAFGIRIVNDGPGPATNIVVTFDVSGLNRSRVVVSRIFEVPNCARSGPGFVCRWTRLEQTAAMKPFIDASVVKGSPAGPAGSMTVRVTSDQQPDPRPENNSATIAFEVLPPAYADLQIVNDSPRATVGDVVTVHVTVTNKGPHDSGSWGLFVRSTPSLAFVSGPCVPENDMHRCPGRVLAAGQSQAFALAFRVLGAENYYCAISRWYQYPDPNPDNDHLCGNEHGIVTYVGSGSGRSGTGGSGGSRATAPPTGAAPASTAAVPVGETYPSAAASSPTTDDPRPTVAIPVRPASRISAPLVEVVAAAVAIVVLGVLVRLRRRRGSGGDTSAPSSRSSAG